MARVIVRIRWRTQVVDNEELYSPLQRYPRMRVSSITGWVAVCAFFVGLALALSTRYLVDRIPQYLYQETRQALWAVGISGAEIAMDGRDAILTGVRGSPHVSEQAVTAVRSVLGVRQVRLKYVEGRAGAPVLSETVIPESGEITFQTGSAAVTLSSLPSLGRVAAFMRQDPSLAIEIQGHTDSEGDPQSNLVLSQARAEVVRNYLIMKGVEANRLVVSGFGSSRPRASNSTDEGRRMNRRIEFRIRGVT